MHDRERRATRRIPNVICTAVLLVATTGAFAQAYPQRPVRIIVPYPPGSGTDIVARILGQRIGENWGQTMIVENRPGAGAIVGVDAVAKATPDGYTVGMADTGPLAINPALYAKLPYDAVRDFTPVTEVAKLPFMLVAHPSLGVSSVAELIAVAKRRPGQINYASVGNGSAVHLATELFKKQAGIDLVHIPYKGSAPALNDVLAGAAQVMFVNLLSGLQHVKSGRLRALAVGTSQRIRTLPDVPTIAEAGVPGYEFQAWFGVIAPAGIRKPVVERLNAEFRHVLSLAEIRDRLQNDGGMEAVGGTAAQFASLIASEQARWGKLVKETGARVD
jgi:tripartite-type tricarboxylate transporter receptor subunit TctC